MIVACVQTSPLPQIKSGEERKIGKSLFSRFFLREGGRGRLYTGKHDRGLA